MSKVRIVSQYPYTRDPNTIYYNRTLREISVNTPKGHTKFQSIFIPKEIDVISVNGWYPIYESSDLAESNSPSSSFIVLGQAELGPAPAGVTYPVYMPVGVTPSYQGNYVDPGADDDGDGILNFRDPDIIGSSGLPNAGYSGVDPFTTSTGVDFNILDYLSNPTDGVVNDTSQDIVLPVDNSGIIVGPNGEVKAFFGPGAAIVPPGWVLFEDIDSTDSPLPEPTPAYTADPFSTNGGDVNIKDFIQNPDQGSSNKTGSPIQIDTLESGVIVCDDGSVTLTLPGTITLGNSCTFFKDIGNLISPIAELLPAYTDDPLDVNGNDVNVKNYLNNPGPGSKNDTGTALDIQINTKSIVIKPDGTVVIYEPPTLISLEDGDILISEIDDTLSSVATSFPTPSAVSIQWFEENPQGNLVLRNSSFESVNPAVQYWENVGADSIAPRTTPYSSNTESAQFFDEDSSGNISPL